MNQFTWTFVDDFGTQNVVGVAHGAKTGHLVVYVNTKIVLIDFKVFASNDYSFFIGDELVNLSIRAKGKNEYAYGCEIDKKTNTPRNQQRKKREKQYWKQTLMFIGGLVSLVLLCSFGAIYLEIQRDAYPTDEELLANAKGKSVVKIFIDEEEQVLQHVFIAKNRSFSKEIELTNQNAPILLKNGMPLVSGDEFKIKYVPVNPRIYHVDYTNLTAQQLQKYLKRALEKQMSLNDQHSEEYYRCFIQLAYELEGVTALANILHQDIAEKTNQQFNEVTYKRLIRSVAFQNELKKRCW